MARTVFFLSLVFRSLAFPSARPFVCALIPLVISMGPAWADGKAFPGAMIDPASLTMPDQRALITYSEGFETLAIETSIRGVAGETAWIIPLPSVPEIEAGTPGLFPTTQRVFADPVLHARANNWDLALWLVTIVLALAVLHQCRSRLGNSLFRVSVLGVIVLLIGSVLLPSLSAARAGLSKQGSPVIHRAVIGGLDVVTLGAHGPADLLGWLDDHGFACDPAIEPVVASYLDEGWVFVAARMAAASENDEIVTPMPLVFRFPVEAPVYPMRLTGVGNGPLEVELFVFGNQRAATPGLAVRTCAKTVSPAFNQDGRAPGVSLRYGYEGPELVIAHPGLRAIVGDLQVGTHLVGTLSPAQMTEDVGIGWEEFRQTRRMPYSPDGMRLLVWRCGGGALATALLVAFVFRRRSDRVRWFVVGPPVLVITLVGAAVPLLVAPRVTDRTSGPSPIRLMGMHGNISKSVAIALELWAADRADQIGLAPQDSSRLELARRAARAKVAALLDRGYPDATSWLAEVDAPLGYTIREGEHGLEYIWYGEYGQEVVIPLDEE